MKNKSYKLKQLEKSRYSILTNDLTTCYMCGRPKRDLHEIFEGAHRTASMRYGLVLPLCRRCHDMVHSRDHINRCFKKIGQTKFEENHTREQFIKIFGQNYKD